MAEQTTDSHDQGILKTAATKLGSVAGSLASLASSVLPHGKTAAANTTPEKKPSGKLVKKNKSRLPRREKKALAKRTAAKM